MIPNDLSLQGSTVLFTKIDDNSSADLVAKRRYRLLCQTAHITFHYIRVSMEDYYEARCVSPDAYG
jgi:hypothetical protein